MTSSKATSNAQRHAEPGVRAEGQVKLPQNHYWHKGRLEKEERTRNNI